MADPTRSRRNVGTTERARTLRNGGNSAEGKLWNELKDRRQGGYKFVRQLPIGPYFADFACREVRLVIEVDGSQHAYDSRDRRRDEFMRSAKYSVLRVWNVDVLKHTSEVCETILAALDGRLKSRYRCPRPEVCSSKRWKIAPSPALRATSPPPRGGEEMPSGKL